VKTLEKR
jgi:hypothetical protein